MSMGTDGDALQAEGGELHFTVDFPAIYGEFTSLGNIHNIGPGGAMALRVVLLGLKRIAQIALAAEDHETLSVLADLGIVDLDEEEEVLEE